MSIKTLIIAAITPTFILIPGMLVAGMLATYHNYRAAKYE